MPPTVKCHFVHHLPPVVGLGPASLQQAAILSLWFTLETHPVEDRYGTGESRLNSRGELRNVEREEEAKGSHREAQDWRALSLAEQVSDVQHGAVAANCEDEIGVIG